MAEIVIRDVELLEEIALLGKTVSLFRMELKVRSKHEDELTVKVAHLEHELAKATAPKPNRAARRQKAKETGDK